MTTADGYAGYKFDTNAGVRVIENSISIVYEGRQILQFADGSRGEFVEMPEIMGETCKKFAVLGCLTCYEKTVMKPDHAGSPACQSGSLASGGNYTHCTCDTCF